MAAGPYTALIQMSFDGLEITSLPGFPGGTTQFLRADGTFAVPPGGAGTGIISSQFGDVVSDGTQQDVWGGSNGLPANTLAANGEMMRLTAWWHTGALSGAPSFASFFDGLASTPLMNEHGTGTVPANTRLIAQILIIRTGPNSQVCLSEVRKSGSYPIDMVRVDAAADLSVVQFWDLTQLADPGVLTFEGAILEKVSLT